jgi:hypothetical protein
MPSVYTNHLRLEEIGTGEQSGDWGATTNTNLELIAEAFSYSYTGEAIANSATDDITVADGASDQARALYLKLTGGGQACTVTLKPNDLSKIWMIENTTSYTLTMKQGSGATVAIKAGQVKIIATDGQGSSAAVYDLAQDLAVPDLFVDDDLTLQSDGAIVNFGADSDVNLTHVADTGLLLNSTRQLQFGDSGTYIHQSADGVLDLVSDTEIEINATTIDMNGALEVSGAITGASTLQATTITATTAVVPDASDGAALGTTTLEWSDLYLADGAVIYFGDDQDITLTHTADTGLTTNGTFQATTITATTAVVPDANDGAALGTTSLEWSDLFLADGAVINLGNDQDVTLTHVADTGILLNSTRQLQFGDSGTYIHQSADGVLDLVSDTEIEINATTVDINGAVDVSGNLVVGGDLTITGDDLVMGTNTSGMLLIADGTNFNPTAISSLSEISTAADDDVLIAIDTSGGGLKKITRSAIIAGTGASGDIANVVEDTSPQLGGDLDMNGADIVTTSNATIDLAPNGTGTVVVRGNTNSGAIVFNCENNSHGQKVYAQPHSASVTNTLMLPAGADSTLVSLVSADTLTNKTFGDNTSFGDNNITNVGDIALDSISADGTDINVAVSDNSATAFTIKQGSDAYLIIDTANSSESVSIGTGISGTAITLGHSTSEVTVADNLTVTGDLTVSGTTTTVNSTTVNLNDHNIVLDSGNSTSAVINGAGITIEGGSGDDATFTYNTTGPKFELKLGSSHEDLQVDGLIAGSLDISGAADIAGDLTLSAGADGALRFSAASSVKIKDNEGASLVFEEADTAYMTFVTTNSSEAIKFDKALDINADMDIDAAIQLDGTLTIGANDQGYDVILYGDTASANMTWDTSADDLIFNGAAGLIVPDGQFTLGSTAVTSTAAELNLLDGGTSVGGSITLADADGFVVNDGGTMKTIPASDVKTYAAGSAATKGFAIAAAIVFG